MMLVFYATAINERVEGAPYQEVIAFKFNADTFPVRIDYQLHFLAEPTRKGTSKPLTLVIARHPELTTATAFETVSMKSFNCSSPRAYCYCVTNNRLSCPVTASVMVAVASMVECMTGAPLRGPVREAVPVSIPDRGKTAAARFSQK